MTQTNYHRGRRLEQELARQLRAAGFEVTRAAGSKSKFDLIASNRWGCGHIQVKTSKPSNLMSYLQELQAVCPSECTAFVVVKNHRRRDFTCWRLMEGVVTPTTI